MEAGRRRRTLDWASELSEEDVIPTFWGFCRRDSRPLNTIYNGTSKRMQVTNQQTESMVEYYNCRAYEGRSHRLSCNPDMLSDEEHAVMFNTMMHEMNAHSRSTKIFETRHCSRKSNGDPKSLQKPLNP